MSVFGSILSKIFQHPRAKAAQTAPQAAPSQPAQAQATPQATPAATPVQAQPAPAVDVEAVLTAMAEGGQTLDWRHSIVDLLKLLSIDSGRANREELARELGYTGSTEDSAAMNVWLHKAVMRKLAENGGIVPDELR